MRGSRSPHLVVTGALSEQVICMVTGTDKCNKLSRGLLGARGRTP